MVDALLFGIASQTNSGVPTRYTEQTLLLLRRCHSCPTIHRYLSELELGSGGELYRQGDIGWSQSNPLVLTSIPSTGGSTRLSFQPKAEIVDGDVVVESVSYKLAFIKAVFSLNMSELASVLKTTRPSVYTWAKDETHLHAHNVERLSLIYELAKVVSEEASDIGSLVRQNFSGSPSVVTLLSADIVIQESVQEAITAIVHHQAGAAKSRKAARKAFALEHSLRLPSREESQEKVDILTGKRGSDQS